LFNIRCAQFSQGLSILHIAWNIRYHFLTISCRVYAIYACQKYTAGYRWRRALLVWFISAAICLPRTSYPHVGQLLVLVGVTRLVSPTTASHPIPPSLPAIIQCTAARPLINPMSQRPYHLYILFAFAPSFHPFRTYYVVVSLRFSYAHLETRPDRFPAHVLGTFISNLSTNPMTIAEQGAD